MKIVEKDNNLIILISLPSIKIKEISFILNEDKKMKIKKQMI